MQRLTSPDGEHAVLHDLAQGSAQNAGRGANRSAGEASPAVLFTHGNGLNAGMWATVTPHLADAFNCWGLDFRGHGASRITRTDLSLERPVLAREIIAAVDYLRSLSSASPGSPASSPPIFAVGHSLGAACLLLAEMANPGTFDALWLYEPVLLPADVERTDSPSVLVEAARRRRAHFESQDAAVDRFMSKPPFSNCEPAAVRAYVELGTLPDPAGGVQLSCSGETEARVYEFINPTNFKDLAQVRCPTVVARGGTPAIANELPPQLAEPVSASLGDGRLLTFDKQSHFGPMEDGALIADAIRSHFEDVAAANS